jgi:hypothetical protein
MDLESIFLISSFPAGIALAAFMIKTGFPYIDKKVGDYILNKSLKNGIVCSRTNPVRYDPVTDTCIPY